jgi:hypothetical protein
MPAFIVTDPVGGKRTHEPVIFEVDAPLDGDLWLAQASSGETVTCQRLRARSSEGRTALAATVSFNGETELRLIGPQDVSTEGIREMDPCEADAFVRLDTGCFDLEMCSGTAQGTGSSKWGLRRFRSLAEGIDLLPGGNNAIGGFYGPFFTPENGLINPPEHTKVEIEVIESGPVLRHYRMHGVVPDGLLPELQSKTFSIDWVFTYGTPYFTRMYRVDDFQTIINGRSTTNKITVGDEFEAGPGGLLFDRYEAYGGTRYRAGDAYAGQLVEIVNETIARGGPASARLAEFRNLLGTDMQAAHWDLYWRLVSAWEGALGEHEIREQLRRVRTASHVLADLPDREWILTARGQGVNVPQAPDQTIFPGPASKTAEYHSGAGRAMVWWTSKPSGAFQIVQRRSSGWANWGTNSENECPELPVGAAIKTAYGQFAETWEQVADQLETAPHVTAANPG